MRHPNQNVRAQTRPRGRTLAVCALAGLMAACAQAPKTLYTWDAYQPSVYAYLKDEDTEVAAQAQTLESHVETARAKDMVLPPGFRAHLGMLYLKMGLGDKAAELLQAEKLAFPEGTTFMDFLLRNVAAGAVRSSVETDKQERKK